MIDMRVKLCLISLTELYSTGLWRGSSVRV